MQIVRGLHNLRPEHRGCVATIGNFDGVHVGHQEVLGRLLSLGKSLGVPATVITFEPQPLEYFAPDEAPSRLTRLREKLQVFVDTGVERVVILEFGPRLAEMRAEVFVEDFLVAGLDVRTLLVGDDFRFGKDRVGDFRMLREAGDLHGFDVANLDTFFVGEERVSSTRVREALAAGDLRTAERCLGRPYRICGRVGHGDKRGRRIGFPTANIDLHRRVSPLRGVYAVFVKGLDGDGLPGVANIGTRPTVQGDPRYLLEVHLLDFSGDIYRAHLQVEFRQRLRDERRFPSFDELRKQIGKDAQMARALFGLPLDPAAA